MSHSKAFGMTNLQYEIRIPQKIYNRATITEKFYYENYWNRLYYRLLSQTMNPPFTMVGSGVYTVRESKDRDFPKGAIVIGSVGWIKTGEINCFF